MSMFIIIQYIGDSALSFALLEIGVSNNPLFSLLHQKIDFFPKKTVKFFWGATAGKVRLQMSKII